MREIDESKIQEIIQGNTENLNIEFKETFDFNDKVWMREKLIRSIFAMSNTRNGGYIVIGIKENDNKTFSFNGVKEEHITTFNNDNLKSKVESFSSFPVNYEIGYGLFNDKKYILISVSEFLLNPIICKKNGEDKEKILEEGAIYIRTLKDKPSSVKITNPIDIQDILDRATDKQIIYLHKRGWQHSSESLPKEKDSDKSSFEKQRKGF
jgi:predicted HTH transcriptional regulator